MRLLLLLPSLGALAAPATAQHAPPPVTREQAMTLPPNELADIVLRQLGAQVTSVTRPNFNRSTGMDMVSALQDLTFATAPHATDVVGLCAANRIEVEFEAPAQRPGVNTNRPETPVRARSVRATEVYKVVGEIEPYAEVSEDRAAEEDRRCAEAGPVIPADYNDHGRATFFQYSGGIDRVTALLVLQRAIGEAREGRYRDIGCVCDNPSQTLGGLDLANLTAVGAAPAGVGGNRSRYRIAAGFLIPGDSGQSWTVTIEADVSEASGLADSIHSLGRTEISRMVVDD
jgi:hypothetical protein